MADYFEEESSYESSQGSDLDEPDQAWSNEEDGCDGSCSDDNYSMSEYGDVPAEAYPEAEPPDYSHGDTSYQGDLEEEREQEEDFSETGEVYGGEVCSQSGEAENKKSLMLKRDHGHEQGPESYLRWEQDMEDWFQHHNIQEEEKPIIAEDTLTNNAFWHWDHEAYYWLDDHPIEASWADMKEILCEEYVVEAEINGKDYFESTVNPKPRRMILATRPS
ncbi:hypothetical protein F2Q68_00039310 [Brassica cretica]|nr:hypothetical protein F2Q68_00039310 [Brassica cretica]